MIVVALSDSTELSALLDSVTYSELAK